jgi:hypothetical protein
MDILSASKAAQLEWLLKQFPKEDIDDLRVRAYEQPIGCCIVHDEDRLQDCLENPDASDLGWMLQGRIKISDARAEAINAGAEISSAEHAALRALLLDQQSESEEGTYISGFSVSSGDDSTIFAAFMGLSEGQGGIRYEFAGLFKSRATAVQSFMSTADVWIEL